jgi:CheY-like chemotaxis protein
LTTPEHLVMTSSRPKLVVVPGFPRLDARHLEALETVFDLEVPGDLAQVGRILRKHPSALLLCALSASHAVQDLATAGGLSALESLADGVGMVDASGIVLWANRRLLAEPEGIRHRFAEACVSALERFNAGARDSSVVQRQVAERVGFSEGDRRIDLLISPASMDPVDATRVASVLALMLDVTDETRRAEKLAAIERAGEELLQLETSTVAELHVAERLRLLEERVIRHVRTILGFDHFELRLTNRETRQLELVIAVGIAPLKIGESIFAQSEGQGISGVVATSGESYLCPDVRVDPHYREGLVNAASSLTVPLRHHDRVIGVFNAESTRRGVFTDDDRVYAEAYGRCVARALHTLDLLVVERFTTSRRAMENVIGEMNPPLEAIEAETQSLLALPGLTPAARQGIARIVDQAARIRERALECAAGPGTILDAEQALHSEKPDPGMIGKRVLVADDQGAIRDTVAAILRQKGCVVTACANGQTTIDALQTAAGAGRPYDLVISDIKMPDRNGYEVFRFAKGAAPNTAVILMTGFGYDPHHSIVRSSQEGLHTFLFKPFHASQLIDEVSKALAPAATC